MKKHKDLSKLRTLIIGANGGLARETIKYLIQDGFREIVMAVRSEARGLKAREMILASVPETNNLNLTIAEGFDMNQPNVLEQAIQNLPKDRPFDVVHLAAGGAVFTDSYQKIEWNGQAYERNVFQNAIGSFLSYRLLKKYGLLKKGARVIMSGGEGARGIPGMIPSPHFENAAALEKYVRVELGDQAKYNAMAAIGASKYFAALWVMKAAEQEAGNLDLFWFSPGLTYGTDGLQSLPVAKRWFMQNVMFKVMGWLGKAQSPAAGGRKNASALNGSVGSHGDVLGAPKGQSIGAFKDQRPMNADLTRPELLDAFWNILEEIIKPLEKTKEKVSQM